MQGITDWLQNLLMHATTLSLVAFAAGCLLLLFILNNIRPDNVSFKKPSDKPWLNALAYFAMAFSPFVAMMFIAVFVMLIRVGWEILAGNQITEDADNLRWLVLSFVGLLTALAGLIGTPLALIRVFTTERQTVTAEQGHITDRINSAVAGLGAQKSSSRMGRTIKYSLRAGKQIAEHLVFEWNDNQFEIETDDLVEPPEYGG